MLALIRCGIAAALMMLVSIAAAQDRIDVAIVFVVDNSGSMGRDELRLARQSHIDALRSSEVQSALADGYRVAVAYVEFHGKAERIMSWALLDGPAATEAVDAFLSDAPLVNVATGTSISAGLLEANDLFRILPWSADRLVVDVVGDGRNSTGPGLGPARQALFDRGAIINGLPLMLEPHGGGIDEYYRKEIIGGPGSFAVPVVAIEQMPMALRQKIVQELF